MNPVTKEQIILAEQQLAEAMISHDVIILEKLLHDNLLFHTPDGNVITSPAA